MAFSSSKTSTIAFMAVVIALFSLLGETFAADAPAPGPSSSASGNISLSISAAFVLSLVAFLFGSFFQ
ncbi:hypothetical protein AQUCO_02000364v1 [Aquilegia coerulea]|uniref:Uncharacterized protein n=1 Tax=Aquilegia coerulea TaxID=218851 RepID=A0A2G5DH80_AQUCA|nr:hypothetical protein AQUCO_02000364v1 [Aquilegia coerulea]